ncbi:MAG TPA: toll/interleukin-1 receptor domain-containing protein [Pyrinomonadaceae bacterium]|jgi:hypothetical protein
MAKSNIKVFVSHSSADEDTVKSITHILKNANLPVWSDQEIKPGEKWQETLEKALSEARVYLIFITPHSLKSPWANFEMGVAVSRAVSEGVKIIPVLLGGVSGKDLPPAIRTWQGIDASEMGTAELASVIESRLEKEFKKEKD